MAWTWRLLAVSAAAWHGAALSAHAGAAWRAPATACRPAVLMLGSKRPSQAPEPCNVALTHTTADFDSLAAAVALAKLWSIERSEVPTHVVLPRGANPLVARFLTYHKHLLPVRGFNTIAARDVRAVGVVDVRSRERLGPAEAWLDRASHVAVYDHHVGGDAGGGWADGDIEPDELILEPVGSATTLLVERLRAYVDSADTELELSEAEATLFMLGIRADTGALSYSSTTARDGHALVWLMEHGASQTAIAEFGHARLSAAQRDVLSQALSSAESVQHEGLKIGHVLVETGRGFITGMAAVAEELLQLLSLDVILLGTVHENARGHAFLSLTGRASARAQTVDLAGVLQQWGGGGHPFAAAASLRLEPPAEEQAGQSALGAIFPEVAEAERVLAAAHAAVIRQVPPQVRARELMTTSVHTCTATSTMDDARQLMQRMQAKALPVIDGSGQLLGMVKLRDAMKAVGARKGSQRVSAWMRRIEPHGKTVTVKGSTPLDQLEKALVTSGGRLPVVDEEGKLLGLVTRTDVLRQHKLYDGLNRRVR